MGTTNHRADAHSSEAPARGAIKLAPVALLVVACGGPVHTTPASTGCPSAELVALAEWNPRAVGRRPTYEGTPKGAAWLVRLGFVTEEHERAEAGPIASYEIAKLGLGPLPAQVWLLRAGLPPCAARVAGYTIERVEDGPRSFRISAVLGGCEPTGEDASQGEVLGQAFSSPAWISFAGGEPSECRVEVPARTGSGDAGGVALPSAWEGAVPAEPCDDCKLLWAVDDLDGEPAISAVTVTQIPAGAEPCAQTYDSHGFYATSKDAAPVKLAIEGDFVLAGALADKRGLRAMLLTGVDTWAAYDVGADGALGAGRRVQFFLAHEEDRLHHSLVPSCGP